MPKEHLSSDLAITLPPSRVLKWLRVQPLSQPVFPLSQETDPNTELQQQEDKGSSQGAGSELRTGQESEDALGTDNARIHPARPSGQCPCSREDDGFVFINCYSYHRNAQRFLSFNLLACLPGGSSIRQPSCISRTNLGHTHGSLCCYVGVRPTFHRGNPLFSPPCAGI